MYPLGNLTIGSFLLYIGNMIEYFKSVMFFYAFSNQLFIIQYQLINIFTTYESLRRSRRLAPSIPEGFRMCISPRMNF